MHRRKTKPKFKSDVFAAIHSSATALAKVGAIDKTTMRSFDASCLAAPAFENGKGTNQSESRSPVV